MGSASVQQMADRVSALMEERLQVRGKTLEDKLQHGARMLPRRVRSEAKFVARAAALARDPGTVNQVDHARLAEAYNACVFHLRRIDNWGRIRRRMLVLAGAMLTGLVAGVVVLAALLVWRGYL